MNETMMRPLERRVLQLADQGYDEGEIAWRFRRSPGFIRQVRDLATVRSHGNGAGRRPSGARHGDDGVVLRPIERRILRWRDAGVGYAEVGSRFRRSPTFVRQVEAIARHKLAS